MAKATKTVSEQTQVEDIVQDLLERLEVEAEFETELKDDVAEIKLDTEDGGMIIGYHGEVLESLQLILALMVSKRIGRFIRISLEVGDYKKNRASYLEHMAQQTKEQALAENREIILPNLKSWERRIIHVILQNDEAVVSESSGEGKDRVLVIKPRVA